MRRGSLQIALKRCGLPAVAIAALALCGAGQASAPPVQAQAYVVQSSVDGRTLAARAADTPRPMASITKLMTVLVALERLPLDRVVTVTAPAARVGESTLDLRAGDRLPVRDLVAGALVPSANDAATALAVAAAGSVPEFVASMNRKARALGLGGTRYRNPHGLDEPGHVSTARDLAKLLRLAVRNPVIRRYAGLPRATLSDGRVDESTDNLIATLPEIVAGKTGHTAGAGWSQAAIARAGRVGITAVVLGEPTESRRDQDLEALLRFGLASYRPSLVVDPRRTYAAVPVGWGRDPLRLVAPRRVVRPAPLSRSLTERIVVPAVAALPVRAGERLGTLVVTDGDRVVARAPLVAAEARSEPSALAKAGWLARRTGHHLIGLLS
jgi:D-alanyl-D-alanine carboxypeptidase (penicillin-binding protein 5/6)